MNNGLSSGYSMMAASVSSIVSDMVQFVDVDVNYKAATDLTNQQLDVNISKDWGRWYLESTLGYGGESRELESSAKGGTVIDALLGYAGGWFGRVMWRSKLAPVVSGLACFTIYELVMDTYVVLMATQYDAHLFLRSLARVPIYTALVYGSQFLLDRLLKPNRSRFAPR